jgi:uncharacterized protein (TIGR01777 family)
MSPGMQSPAIGKRALETVDAVVHLAGASIAGRRWTPAYKREILESRTLSTRALVDAMARALQRPSVFVCASGIDYYGPRGDEPVDESAPPGRSFLAQVCVAWEGEACRAADLGVRTVMIRTGIVLDRREGALARLLLPFQLFVGGPILPGTQWWSWIHLDDEVGLILRCIDDERASGPFNGVAPEPQRNRDFSATLGTGAWSTVVAAAARICAPPDPRRNGARIAHRTPACRADKGAGAWLSVCISDIRTGVARGTCAFVVGDTTSCALL